MMNHSPKTPLDCDNKTIAFLQGQLAQQRQVLRCVRAVLPSPLAEQVKHCLIRDQRLVVCTDSAAWGSQLRFQQQALLDAIAPLNMPVTQVQIKVLTESVEVPMPLVRPANMPSQTTIDNLRKDCLSMNDSEVKQALLSLSETLNRVAKENQAAGRGD